MGRGGTLPLHRVTLFCRFYVPLTDYLHPSHVIQLLPIVCDSPILTKGPDQELGENATFLLQLVPSTRFSPLSLLRLHSLELFSAST